MVSRGPSTQFPLTGQQLMMQLDNLTSAMTDMCVQEENMESEDGMESVTVDTNSGPYSQEEKRRDPIYLTSLASHSMPPPSVQVPQNHQQAQQLLLQQQLEEQAQQEQLHL